MNDASHTQESATPPPRETSLAASAAWLTTARVAAFAMGFVLPLMLVRRLDQTALGLYKQVYLFVSTATMVLPFGIGMSAFYFLPREDATRQRQVVFNIILFHVVVGLVALLALTFAPELLSRIFNSPALTPFAPLIGVMILFWMLGALIDTIAIAHGETKLATAFIILTQFTKTVLLLAAGAIFGTVESLIYAGIAHSVVQTIIVFVYLHSRFPKFWRAFSFAYLRSQFAYALPLGAAGLLFTLQHDLDNYFVSHQFGAAIFAIYSIGCFEVPLIGTLGDAVGSVLIPRISLLQKRDARREIVLQVARVTRKLSAIYFPAYIFLLVMSREVIVLLFTTQYLESVKIYVVNLTMLPFYILTLDPIVRAYSTQGRMLLKLRLVLFPMLLVGLWAATTRGGLVAAISVVVAFHILEKVILTLRLARLLEVTRRDLRLFKDVLKVAAAAIAAGVVAELLRLALRGFHPFVMIVACGVLFVVVYVAVVWLARIVTTEERAMLFQRLTNAAQRLCGRRAAADSNIAETLT